MGYHYDLFEEKNGAFFGNSLAEKFNFPKLIGLEFCILKASSHQILMRLNFWKKIQCHTILGRADIDRIR